MEHNLTNLTLISVCQFPSCVYQDTPCFILAAILMLLSLLGMLGNSLVIIAVCLSQRLRTATNAFIFNLSLADFLTCFLLPSHIYGLLSGNHQDNVEPHQWLCLTTTVAMYTSGSCSVLTIAFIACNRYILISKSVKQYRAIYQAKSITLMLSTSWMLCLTISAVPSVLRGLKLIPVGVRIYGNFYTSSHLNQYYRLGNVLIFYPISMTVMIFCYVKIFQLVKVQNDSMVELTTTNSSSTPSLRLSIRRNKSVKRRIWKRQLETTKNLFYIVVTFMICYTPYCVCVLLPATDLIIPWAGAILLLSTVLNPIIYATKHPYFKRVFRQIIRCKCADISKVSMLQQQLAASARTSVHSEF